MKLIPLLLETHSVNPEYFQKLLNSYSKISPSTKKIYQGIIDTVRKKGGTCSQKQYDVLQKLKKGSI